MRRYCEDTLLFCLSFEDSGMNPFLESLSRINELGVPYLAVGGFSVVMHGVNRFTPDLNLMVDLGGEFPAQLFEGLQKSNLTSDLPCAREAFCSEQGRLELMQAKRIWCLPFKDPELPNFSVDIFLKHPVDFQQLYERRVEIDFSGCKVPLVSIEDLIVMKHIANRGQDKVDIESLLVIQDIQTFVHDERRCREYVSSISKTSARDQVENLIEFYKLNPMAKAEWLAEMLAQLGKFCFV